jgi:hypothetical protein
LEISDSDLQCAKGKPERAKPQDAKREPERAKPQEMIRPISKFPALLSSGRTTTFASLKVFLCPAFQSGFLFRAINSALF